MENKVSHDENPPQGYNIWVMRISLFYFSAQFPPYNALWQRSATGLDWLRLIFNHPTPDPTTD